MLVVARHCKAPFFPPNAHRCQFTFFVRKISRLFTDVRAAGTLCVPAVFLRNEVSAAFSGGGLFYRRDIKKTYGYNSFFRMVFRWENEGEHLHLSLNDGTKYGRQCCFVILQRVGRRTQQTHTLRRAFWDEGKYFFHNLQIQKSCAILTLVSIC